MDEPTFSSPNPRWLVATLPSRETAVAFAAAHLLETGQRAIDERGLFSLALSGGSTPKAIFAKLSEPDVIPLLDWSRVLLFWSDERNVPPDHADSNYHNAMQWGLKALPLREEHIFRMHAESDLEVNAAAYEHLLKEKTQGVLDLTMLGMGGDGHTASLFPNTKALEVTDRLVTANQVPQLETQRMTFTFPCINASRATAIYVLGEEKRERLTEVLKGPEDHYPVQRVGTDERPALWITDVALD
jgi:6-phosphogluconolactonase